MDSTALPRFQRSGEFSAQIRSSSGALFAHSKSGRFASTAQWLWSFGFLAAFCACYAALLALPLSGISLLLAACLGALSYTILAAFAHDASHGSLHPIGWVNTLAVYLSFAIIGVHGRLWRHRHLKRHHPFPNVDGNDVDADGSSLIRLSPHKAWHAHHRWQPLFAPILYALVLVHLAWIEDVSHWRKYAREAPGKFAGPGMILSFTSSKIFHLVLFLLVPWLCLQPPVWALILGYLVATGAASLLFVLINVGSHISDQAEFPKKIDEGAMPYDWANHQLATAIDWSPTNPAFVALTGGANAHAGHHLFPSAAHCHNANLSRIVARHSAGAEVRYNLLTFNGMIAAHWRHLTRLSRP